MSDELRPGEIVHTDQHYPAIVLVVHGDPRQKVNLLVTRDDDEEHPVWVHTYVPHSQPGQDHTWHRVIDCTPTITTKAPDPLPFNEETWGLRRTIGLQDARIHELEQALIDFSRNGLATSVRPANSDLWSPVLWHQYLERISDTVKRKASYALDRSRAVAPEAAYGPPTTAQDRIQSMWAALSSIAAHCDEDDPRCQNATLNSIRAEIALVDKWRDVKIGPETP
jgi:hypothetical protein